MSESDDTDVLLLLPPDLFTVASSGSSDSLENGFTTDNQVVTNIIEHVQYLNGKINTINMKDTKHHDHSFTRNLGFNDGSSRYDLPSSENNTSLSRVNMSPSASLRKYQPRSQDFLSPIRPISGTNSQLDNLTERRYNGFSQMYIPTTTTTTMTTLSSGGGTNGLDGVPVSRSSNNESNKFDLKYEGKEPTHSAKTNFIDRDIISSDYSFMKNNNEDDRLFSSETKKILDRLKDKKNDQERASLINDFNTINPREYNFFLDSQQNDLRATSSPNKIQQARIKNSELPEWKSKNLLSLDDFWNPDVNKSENELLKIKLEEEKFRREHCEQVIQELQKKLLEQQEKVAVAIAIDKEKKQMITQYQKLLNKFKEQWLTLENDYKKLQDNLSDNTLKYKNEINELELKLKNEDKEKLKSIDTAIEYKDKYETVMREKINLLESHENELENYKKFVTEAEARYEQLKNNYDKLLEKNVQLEESSGNYQQELSNERLKASKIRDEMSHIHKALDTCGAELSVLRQEKENLQLRLKEEKDRCTIMDRKRTDLLEEINCLRKNEQVSKDEIKSIISQHEEKRTELRDIYQKQVEDVVQVKLKEFQLQLDTAEVAFQNELETKQRVIAECAARKIKTIIDKHQEEIKLLEERYNEEKRLHEIRYSKINNKAVMLEAQLNSQEAAKSRIAEQLHTLMEKQWKQAMQIISPGIQDNYDIIDRKRDEKNIIKYKNNHCDYSEPVKLHGQSSNHKNYNYLHQEQQEESLVGFTSTDHSPGSKLMDSQDELKRCIQSVSLFGFLIYIFVSETF